MRRISIIVFASLISACAHVDTGQVDYRVADPFKPDAASGAKLRDCKTSEKPCPWHADLDRKYVAAHAPFVANNVYSVELEQAFIGKNLLEGHILGRQFGKHGEYAILANAFEFGADEASKFIQAPEYGGEKASENNTKLKLVYYGDDIAKRQPFNFSNIPLMPRAVYGGGSVGIQIVVMEIDAQAGPVTSLLGTLAEFGKNSIPGPPGATDILFALGDSLLKGSQDDRLFDYRFVLSNGASIAADGSLGPVATFAPGRYVFRRRDERVTTMNWDDLSTARKIMDYLWHIALPITAMVLGGFAVISILTKNSVLEEIRKQYVLTARAKGVAERDVMWRHVFRNAMIPIMTGFPAAFVGAFFSGSLLIETLFSLDGLGLLSYESVIRRDYPVVLGSLFLFTLIGLMTTLLRDLSYLWVDPRVKFD